jgi:GNAT superfamily N-acetyltransferase
MLGWLEAGARRPGNPNGVELARFGGAVAATATNAPDLDFLNTVHGLRPADVGVVGDLLAHCRARGVRPWLELLPHERFEALATSLTAGGAAQIGFHAAFFAAPDEVVPPAHDPRVRVRAVEPDRWGAAGRLLAAGHGVPEEHLDGAAADAAHWPTDRGWRVYEADLDGRPAGAAVLAPHEGVAYLANASTLPAARGRGVQTALVRRRLEDAGTTACDLVAALAPFDGPSARNLQRAGLRLAYLSAIWRVLAPPTATA